jgi:hypothetical protein
MFIRFGFDFLTIKRAIYASPGTQTERTPFFEYNELRGPPVRKTKNRQPLHFF